MVAQHLIRPESYTAKDIGELQRYSDDDGEAAAGGCVRDRAARRVSPKPDVRLSATEDELIDAIDARAKDIVGICPPWARTFYFLALDMSFAR